MRNALACLLSLSLLVPLGAGAQPPPGTGGSPPVGPPGGVPDVVIVPDSYAGTPPSSAPPASSASPYGPPPAYGTSPYGTAPYGAAPYGSPSPTPSYGAVPYATPPYGAAPYGATPYAGTVYTAYNVDPRLWAEYEQLPRRGPYITLIVFGVFGILLGLPTLVQEIRYGEGREPGALAFGAIATGLGAAAIGISAYKLHVRNTGIRRLREQGLQVAIGGAPGGSGLSIGARLAF